MDDTKVFRKGIPQKCSYRTLKNHFRSHVSTLTDRRKRVFLEEEGDTQINSSHILIQNSRVSTLQTNTSNPSRLEACRSVHKYHVQLTCNGVVTALQAPVVDERDLHSDFHHEGQTS